MTHRRTFAALGLAVLLVAASACGARPTGRSSLGPSAHRAGSAPIAAVVPMPNITGDPLYEDFAVQVTFSNITGHLECTWQRSLGDIIVNVNFTLTHTGGIPGHQPTSVNFHLVDGDGTRSPTFTSGFTSAYFGMDEPIGTEPRIVKIRAFLDLGAPDSDAGDDHSYQAFVQVPAGVPVGFAPHQIYCGEGAL